MKNVLQQRAFRPRPRLLQSQCLARRAVVTLVTLVALLPRSASAAARLPDDDVRQNFGGRLPILNPLPFGDAWGGGAHSLPYGTNVSAGQVVTAARALAVVQPAVSEFLGRGYIRRGDLDWAAAKRGYAIAILAFQKPGVSVDDEEPCIEVITRPAVTDGIPAPTTQVIGGVWADSMGTLIAGNSETDPPIFMLPVTPPTSRIVVRPTLIDAIGEMMFSDREIAPVLVAPSISPGARIMWEYQVSQCLRDTGMGAVGASGGGPGTMALGALMGLLVWANEYFCPPPDTTAILGHFVRPALVDNMAGAARGPVRMPTPRLLAGGRGASSRISVRGGAVASIVYELDAPARVHIQMLDVQGRRIKNLGEADLEGGTHQLEWNQRDESGTPVANGVYFVSLIATGRGQPARAMTGKIVVAR